ncbi:hypothetical protein B7R74_02035 [Yersinia pseudotuberculosis]|uniref:Uncharacterized protein n=3 Tax=Yersinia pseudotuberculosis complex TaxID=1649845 RepID=A0A0T9JME1_YERPU|nr:hypothetical protein BZ22_1258 [Yersinia pseudotuberculosis YPIII]AYW86771.1 hypothetical protein EGX87_05880 [Yersinia pseudotuberculosis]CRG49116.1 Uncharacterised protein [Yersinia wautersii]AYX01408.1 hypothetical protein EGX53_17080 [Yersinia pseudotuberculosis]AZA29164.1 hypothetical protein DN756_03515 [Yersinia pseudotuberculosis]
MMKWGEISLKAEIDLEIDIGLKTEIAPKTKVDASAVTVTALAKSYCTPLDPASIPTNPTLR